MLCCADEILDSLVTLISTGAAIVLDPPEAITAGSGSSILVMVIEYHNLKKLQ